MDRHPYVATYQKNFDPSGGVVIMAPEVRREEGEYRLYVNPYCYMDRVRPEVVETQEWQHFVKMWEGKTAPLQALLWVVGRHRCGWLKPVPDPRRSGWLYD